MAASGIAVNVAGWGGLGEYSCSPLRVEPKVADRLFYLLRKKVGDRPAAYARGDGVVTAEKR